ncbi:hypothetical protein [Vreelandella arcis]|uniref:Uncharacterized protein n=1 Tax=Vreelandella arcis TaxID=416873 RepID=A0A1H0EH48_9GAMM|nr:hypothetical protein [Halomonas arcis]SDN81688.1 hypothetical protein SAMN04487951_108151 [Halomonas arcis]
MTTSHFSPECPECQSRFKNLPATRRGKSHVYCSECGHDFGRYESLVKRYRHELDTLETQLGITPAASDNAALASPQP